MLRRMLRAAAAAALALAAIAGLGSCARVVELDAVFIAERLAFVPRNSTLLDPGDCGILFAIDDENGPVLQVETGEPFGAREADCPELFPMVSGQSPLAAGGGSRPPLALGRVYLISGHTRSFSMSGAFVAQRRADRIVLENLEAGDPRRLAAERRRRPDVHEQAEPQLNAG